MSYDSSEDDGEWEVVDIVQTTTSVNPIKPKPAKKEDVDKLAQEIQCQLTMKSTQLEEKLRRQEMLSQQQMADIQSKLSQISRVQSKQERQQKDLDRQRQQLEAQQKQALLEQQIKIESLSELTQKQIAEAQQKIARTQQATQNVTENMQTLHQLQLEQAAQQQQQLQDQAQQLQTQQQLTQLAQIQQMTQQAQQPPPYTIPPPPAALNPIPPLYSGSHSGPSSLSNGHPHSLQHPHPMSNGNTDSSGNMNGNGSNSNGWLPSFFMFGNKGSNAVNAHSSVQDMDLGPSPNISTTITTSFEQVANNNVTSPHHPNPILLKHAAEEKANILGDDDDEVLGWNNEYGASPLVHPVPRSLCSNPSLLKTQGMIGEGKFRPSEHRQCGWILKNKSRSTMRINARLECIGGDEDGFGIKVTAEKSYEFSLKPDEEIFVLIEVVAPGIAGKYCAFYQLVMDSGAKVGETLEVMCEVEAEYNKAKEEKIASLIKMGFDDRKKVVDVLKKKNWNLQQSVNALIAM